jgi:hypothetical protein
MFSNLKSFLDNRYLTWRSYANGLIASELSSFIKYYDRLIQWAPRLNDSGDLLAKVETKEKVLIGETDDFPDLTEERDRRTAILLNGTINHHFDIEGLLHRLKPSLSRTSRVALVAYNPYLSWLYVIANRLGIRSGELPVTFVTQVDLESIAKLSGYECVRARPVIFFPFKAWGLGDVLNRWLAGVPVIRWLSFAYISILRPIIPEAGRRPSLTCVIPARNERGNIENALKRMPALEGELEIIFVEGHSTDGTWEEIQRVMQQYQGEFDIKAYRQTGKGKSDAVRLGFSEAKGDLLTILDADLTMPPELLGRFYNAYCSGYADFINGSRLVYPMEGEAMRFLNKLGNVFFAKALSWILDPRLGDTLCGTKLVARHDYQRMVDWRNDFGDVDPFGDFELIFPAATLMLGIVDVPIRYLDRTYGSTNISRFRHGFMLAKMTLIGFYRIRLGTKIWSN